MSGGDVLLFKIAVMVLVVTFLFFIFCKVVNAGEPLSNKLKIAAGTYVPWYHKVLAVLFLLCLVALLYIAFYMVFLWRWGA